VAEGAARPQWRVVASMVCLLLAVAATGAYPLFMGWATNRLAVKPLANIVLGMAILWIVSYSVGRIMMQAMGQLRDGIFAKVQYHAMREVGVKTFAHLHSLSLRFHLERKTGGLSRVIERGTKGIDTLLSFAIFSIFPTTFVLIVFSVEMYYTLGWPSAVVMLITVALYVWFTFAITRWRIQFRRDMNQSDQDANTKTVDSLLNYETVKYFNAEKHETARFDISMAKFTGASIQSQTSLSVLNTGQAAIINVGMGVVLVLAAIGVKAGTYTLGDFATANAILLQLYVPLNLARHGLSRNRPGAGRHGRHVPPVASAARGARQAWCAGAEGDGRRNRLRQCGVRL
jgi:ABC-type multidrug transport system fused ATPase/permease subunit